MKKEWFKISVALGILLILCLFLKENSENNDCFFSENAKKNKLNAKKANYNSSKKSLQNIQSKNSQNIANFSQNTGSNIPKNPKSKKIVELKSSNKDGSSATFSLPAFSIEEIKKNNIAYSQIKSEKLHEYNVFNKPTLPIHKEIFLIPQNTDLELNFEIKSVDLQKIEKLAIGTGDYLRKEKPPEVNDEFYQQATGVYPEKAVVIEDIIEFRGHKMAVVTIYPFAYDTEKRELIIRNQIDFSLSTPNAIRILNEPENYADFAAILEDTTINYSAAVKEYETQTRATVTTSENGKLLLVFPDKFDTMNLFIETDLNEFIDWKTSIGWNVSKLKISLGNNVNTIKTLIDREITNKKITHIILIGDAEHIPSRTFQMTKTNFSVNDAVDFGKYDANNYAYSDSYYAGINSVKSDYIADVILSRISAKNIEQVKNQLSIAIKYEKGEFLKNESSWLDWNMKTTLLASEESSNGSNEYNSIKDFTHLNNQKAKFLKSSNSEFRNFTTNYEPTENRKELINSFNFGTGLFYYLGHGAYNGFVTTTFNLHDLSYITNQRPTLSMQPVCQTGGFFWSDNNNDSCMAEAQMASGKFIGVLAATSNTYWFPPMNLIEEFTNSLISDNKNTIGAHILYSMNKAAAWSATKESKHEASYFAAQIVSFGDCTLGFRTKKMKTPKYNFTQTMLPGKDNSLRNQGENCFAPIVTNINYKGTKITTINPDSTNIVISIPETIGSFNGQIWSRNSFPEAMIIMVKNEPFCINKANFSKGDTVLNAQLYYPGTNHEILNDSRFMIKDGEIIYIGNNSVRSNVMPQMLMLELSYVDFDGKTKTQTIYFSKPNKNNLFKYSLNVGWNFIGSPVNTQTTSNIFPEDRALNNEYFYWQNSKDEYKSQKISTLNAENAFWVYTSSTGYSNEFSGIYAELPRSTFSTGWDTFSPSSIVPYLQQAECIWEWDSTEQSYREVDKNESLKPMKAYWIFCIE